MKLVLAYLYGMLVGFLKSIPTTIFNIASEAIVAVLVWAVWSLIGVGPHLEYYQVFGLFYIVGVVMRSFTLHLKPLQPPLVYRIETLNGHQYMFASALDVFKKDASVQAAMQAAVRSGPKKRDVKDAVDR